METQEEKTMETHEEKTVETQEEKTVETQEEKTVETQEEKIEETQEETTMNTQQTNSGEFRPWGMEKNTFLMLMHLSQFAGFFTGFGFAAPIVMWLSFKDEDQDIDAHGKEVANFMISALIYGVIGFILTFILIGIFVLLALGVCMIIFTIMAGLKAKDGDFYKYPLTIRFIK